jgi:hypothetical protein
VSDARLAPALRRAAEFVFAQGDAEARADARALHGRASPDGLVALLAARQDAAGALAPRTAALESGPCAATAGALARLDALGLLHHATAERAVAFLEAAQAPDGAWADPADAGEAARIERTAEVAARLARTACARGSTLRLAETFLRARWSPERVAGPRYGPVLAYFEALASLPSELADEALQWCGRELERGFRSGVFDAVATARVFVRCGARALPGTRIAAEEVVEALLRAQQPDGGFPAAAGGEPARVAAALDALLAVLRLGA